MFEPLFTIGVIILMLALLIRNVYEPVIVFLGGLVVLLTAGIIDIREALVGFSNQGMLTVAVLFVVAGAIQRSPLLFNLANLYFGERAKGRRPLLKMMAPVTILSAFLNNTPVVAIFIPIIRNWSAQYDISPSKFLIPLSYASVFGGIITLIGTSTNLLVSGMLEEYGEQSLSMFEITKVGLPLAFVGIAYILFYGYKKLPNNMDLLESAKKSYREYLVTFQVQDGCRLSDKTVKKAGLRNLKGLYLFEIIRNGQKIYPVHPEEVIKPKDKLIFTGQVDTIVQLQSIEGLKLLTSSDDYLEQFKSGQASIVEAVVSPSFPFLHKSIKESNFRTRYQAAVVAVIRNGERINDKIGNIVLKPGDTLLLLADDCFNNEWAGAKDFYLINQNLKNDMLSHKKALLALVSFMLLIVLAAMNILPILHASLISLCILMFSRTVSVKEAWNSISWETLLVIAFSFGIGNALINSGAAAIIAGGIIDGMKYFGPIGVLFAVYFITNLFTEVITNNVAAVLAFPIAYSAAMQMNLDPRPFAIAVAIAASACFTSPIGYQTHLMVYGPGGYSFKDFVRIGLPLDIIFMIAAMILIPIFFPF